MLRGREHCNKRVLRCKDHEGSAPKCVWPRRKDFQIPGVGWKLDFSPFASADPIVLHQLDVLRPIQFREIGQETFSVSRNTKVPLPQCLLFNQRTAPPATAVNHLFICQHGLFDGIPIDRRSGTIGKPKLTEIIMPFAMSPSTATPRASMGGFPESHGFPSPKAPLPEL